MAAGVQVRTALMLLAILLALLLWRLVPPDHTPAARALYAKIDRGWVNARMYHHGIDGAVYDGRRFTFEREGKPCRL